MFVFLFAVYRPIRFAFIVKGCIFVHLSIFCCFVYNNKKTLFFASTGRFLNPVLFFHPAGFVLILCRSNSPLFLLSRLVRGCISTYYSQSVCGIPLLSIMCVYIYIYITEPRSRWFSGFTDWPSATIRWHGHAPKQWKYGPTAHGHGTQASRTSSSWHGTAPQ